VAQWTEGRLGRATGEVLTSERERQVTDLSAHQLTMTVLMTPETANFAGNVHGGTILNLLDQVAYACTGRYAGSYVVTLSGDQVIFRQPVHVGELVTFLASVNSTGRTSMEIGIKVLAEDIRTKEVRHVNSCCFTMVALDGCGEPVTVTPVRPFSPAEKRRHAAAVRRRRARQEVEAEDACDPPSGCGSHGDWNAGQPLAAEG